MAIYKYKKNLDKLTKLQFEVTQNNATEPSFNNKYWDNNEEGIYVDITTGEPYFYPLINLILFLAGQALLSQSKQA